MRTRLMTAALVLFAGGMAGALEGDVAGWVRDLASEDPAVRDAAEEKLSRAGESARAAIEEAARSEDPEVVMRANRLLRRLASGPQAPADPPEVRRGPRPSVSMQVITRDGRATVTQGADGHVRVVETRTGQEPQTYEADSPEEFAEKFPEIAKKYGLGDGSGGFSFGGGRKAPGVSPEDEELLRELERMTRDLLDREREGRRAQREGQDLDELQKELEEALRELKEPGAGASGLLGVRVAAIDEALRTQLDLPEGGVLVREVEEGSRAEAIGVQEYDVLLTVNGSPVASAADIRRAMTGRGRELTVEIVREGERKTLTADGK
ncbi:MAG: PDZ domain-containing protein [Candidatus Brocadiae bacterium]|nr:PDZ domain-containing protein [Candidatus Brocadiia bacterium]